VALVDHPRHSRLLVIGGAERSDPGGGEILRRFVDLAGGAAAELIVIATASAEPAAGSLRSPERFGPRVG
jgi:cyanophycinase